MIESRGGGPLAVVGIKTSEFQYTCQAITYDASGNPTSYKGAAITWNGRLMTSFTKDDRRYEYSYNSDGMRTVKRVYEGDELVYTYTYIWDGDVLLAGRMEVTDADEPITIRYLYDDSGELYGMDYNGNGYFGFIKNLQGDIVSIIPLDSESNVEVNMEYDAWGKPIFAQASSAVEGFLMAVMMLVTNVGYRGYFYDFDTGLYYLRSRYYDPEIGRFINADDTDYLGYDNLPLGMNLFSYCENNPVNGRDPLGKFSEYQYHQLAKENLSHNRKFDDKISGYINGQNSYPYNKMYYGAKDLGYNGCELIAIYNAFYALDKKKKLSSIIYDFEYNGKMWMYGFFGTKPSEIGKYLLKNKLKYTAFTLTKKWMQQHRKMAQSVSYHICTLELWYIRLWLRDCQIKKYWCITGIVIENIHTP